MAAYLFLFAQESFLEPPALDPLQQQVNEDVLANPESVYWDKPIPKRFRAIPPDPKED